MKLQTLKYPNRADMLELLKAREEGGSSAAATSRTGSAPGASRPEAPACFTVPSHAAR